jgi:hypothetical protein
MLIWHILWYFGIFLPFWYVVPRKSGTPGSDEYFELLPNRKLFFAVQGFRQPRRFDVSFAKESTYLRLKKTYRLANPGLPDFS